MLYVGSFHNYKEEENRSAHFVYFAEADDPNGAVEIFKAGIAKVANQPDTSIHGKIYLESIVEVGSVPPGGAMAFLAEIDYQDPGSTISCVLPGDSCGLESYRWSEGDKELDDMAPFLTIPAPVGPVHFTKKRRR
ncbi:MAG: hypothetical protein NT140_04720 [Deltaproteobacteria bacterium]|nr:hypothetical protein [Deltaproteobacteria bacterium]